MESPRWTLFIGVSPPLKLEEVWEGRPGRVWAGSFHQPDPAPRADPRRQPRLRSEGWLQLLSPPNAGEGSRLPQCPHLQGEHRAAKTSRSHRQGRLRQGEGAGGKVRLSSKGRPGPSGPLTSGPVNVSGSNLKEKFHLTRLIRIVRETITTNTGNI